MYRNRTAATAFLPFMGLVVAFLLGGCSSGPPFQGMTSEDLFQLGTREFQEEDWDEAVRVFERLIFADPTFDRMVEARLYLARAYFAKEEYLTAVSEYTRIRERHPGDPRTPEAALGVCRSYAELSPHVQRDQSYTRQALNECGNVVVDFSGTEEAREAEEIRDRMREKLARKVFVGGEFYFDRNMYDSAIIYFNDVLADYPRTPAAAQALLFLYRSYTEIGWEQEAADARERLLQEFPESKAAQEVRAEDNGGGEEGDADQGRVGGGAPGAARSGQNG